ncbi:MAG TPA: DUF554 domain-containing protein [Clostridiaceae bacterium]|nr:DUF554 domain-containing protein [Clostridiaceae bacterium]
MYGTLVNVAAIIVGSILGLLFGKRIKTEVSSSLFRALGLCVIYVGLAGVLETKEPMLLIISIALGTLIGETINIERKLEILSEKVEGLFKGKGDSGIKEGFLTATLLFCVGSMAIIGPLESALTGVHSTLFAKSVLDGISSILFSSTLGIGVMLSAAPVLLYQGSIALFAGVLKPFMTEGLVGALSSVGSLLILGLGLNMSLHAKLKVSNMLPAILVPVVYFFILSFIG